MVFINVKLYKTSPLCVYPHVVCFQTFVLFLLLSSVIVRSPGIGIISSPGVNPATTPQPADFSENSSHHHQATFGFVQLILVWKAPQTVMHVPAQKQKAAVKFPFKVNTT